MNKEEEAILKLKTLQTSEDVETAHVDADDILCDLLKELGYEDVVEAYLKIDKWYA